MKNWKKGLALVCAGLMSVSALAGCKAKGNSVSKDPKTINVEVLKASYGANWVYEIAEKFEAAYASENYKVNILKPSSDMRHSVALQQLARGYEATQVDLYITGGVSSSAAGQEGDYYDTAGVLCEEISDMWDMKPIGYDGKEESKTLREKVTHGTVDLFKDNYGKTYGIPYIASTGGFAVNTMKLAKYGITTLPTTTNELFEMFTKIYVGVDGVIQGSRKTNIYPITYYFDTANAYTIDWWQLAMAQYDEKMFNEYWGWQTTDAEGNVTWMEADVSPSVNEAFLKSAEVMAQAFDYNIASKGTKSNTLDQAQAAIMDPNSGAVFMCNGSWYLNDMALSFKNQLKDITFINFPVVSALADKLWDADEATLEAMLRYAIAQVDDLSKASDPAAIAADMTTRFNVAVSEADVVEVRRARYAYSIRTSSEQMVIAKGSPKADIAKLFMRMVASDDAAKTIAEKANGNSAYMTSTNTYSKHKFVQDASKIFTNSYATGYANKAKGYRLAVGKNGNTFKFNHVPFYIAGLASWESIYTAEGGLSGKPASVYKTLALQMYNDEKAFVQAEYTKEGGWKALNSARIEEYRTILGYNK